MTLPGAGPGETDPQVVEQVEIQAKYAGYIQRQHDEVERSRGQEELKMPADLDYRESAWPVHRSQPKAQPAQAGNPGPSRTHFRRHSGCHLLAAGAFEAPQRQKEKRMSLELSLSAGIGALAWRWMLRSSKNCSTMWR